ncbi:MAG: hypothetical protein SOZ80_04255 [Prevotella sp.]|uniref:hypothetical protein n=1 Tax=Prevotella sp. TaxID=59823 RepID=UPI002A33692A|nr:hypothetical protein [Prevotella sp.]MDD7318948.1 hypothetical protein [Prevotellaceae bacterium]MDY4019974.1 hypothetical protein [Prevotella sp.]
MNVGLNVGLQVPNVGLNDDNVGLDNSNVGLNDNIADKRRYSQQQLRELIVSYCTEWRTAEEIATEVGRNIVYIRDRVLPKLSDVIEKRYDIPHHPHQKYKARQMGEKEVLR